LTVLKGLLHTSVTAVAAGSLHNLAIDDKGIVHTWGCNDDKAVGRPLMEEFDAPAPVNLDGAAAVAVGAGASHSIALTSDGGVFTWGTYRDENGIMGYSAGNKYCAEPAKVAIGGGTYDATNTEVVTAIACGDHHDIALTAKGEVFQWGDVGFGARSSSRVKASKLTPRIVSFRYGRGKDQPALRAVRTSES
jgi:regulator of chromosome condensation